MICQYSDGLTYYQFEKFQEFPIHQGVFTRLGGTSPQPWDSLNVGGTNGDTRVNIIENRRRMFSCFDLQVQSIFDVWQVHGNKVVCAEEPRLLIKEPEKADSIFTNKIGITLFMRFADCVPLLFYDPGNNVIGMAHAGRVGTINRIAADCVKTMQKQYGSRLEDISVGIGPSIGPDHYEIQNDVIQILRSSFRNSEDYLVFKEDGSTFLDLWKLNHQILIDCGIKNLEIAGICTACNTDEWFSHRGENGLTGRFGALLALKEK